MEINDKEMINDQVIRLIKIGRYKLNKKCIQWNQTV